MIGRLRKGKNVNVLFFSNTASGGCEVRDLWKNLSMVRRTMFYFFWRHYSAYLIEVKCDSQSQLIKDQQIKHPDPSRIFVFGYCDEEYPMLRCVHGGSFDAAWFDHVSPKTVMIMFVPGGARILDRPEWAHKVKKYVSFRNKFSFMRDLPVLKAEGNKLFPQLIGSTFKTNDPNVIKNNFSKLFEQSKLNIHQDESISYEDKRMSLHLIWVNDINLISKDG